MKRLLALVLVLVGCNEHPFDKPVTLGGRSVPARVLNRGADWYRQYCRACHGENGDGHGYSSLGLRPPPRDFTQGLFKFGHVPPGSLPPDSELAKIVRGGLGGTAMLPWDVSDSELFAILQYIKAFSPRWYTGVPAAPVEVGPDPFGAGHEAEAIALGERVYHAKAMCSGCHPAYVTHRKLNELSGVTEFSPELYNSKPRASEYCLEWKPGWKTLQDRECAKLVMVYPPNFLRDPLRTVRAGTELNDLYRIIASGIEGVGMPPWKGAVGEDELWGMAYYVRALLQKRGTPEGDKLQTTLRDPANLEWKP
jgi:mono/diheme cytochrome c family protein